MVLLGRPPPEACGSTRWLADLRPPKLVEGSLPPEAVADTDSPATTAVHTRPTEVRMRPVRSAHALVGPPLPDAARSRTEDRSPTTACADHAFPRRRGQGPHCCCADLAASRAGRPDSVPRARRGATRDRPVHSSVRPRPEDRIRTVRSAHALAGPPLADAVRSRTEDRDPTTACADPYVPAETRTGAALPLARSVRPLSGGAGVTQLRFHGSLPRPHGSSPCSP